MARFQPVNLSKNQTINLSKIDTETPLKVVHVGLGWDVHSRINADLDAFVVQVDDQNREIDTLYFGSRKYKGKIYSKDAAIIHSGDNLTGEGEGDDEVIIIHLDKLNPATSKLIVAINIYQARLTFDEVENAFCRLLNAETGELLARYDLSQEFGGNYSMILGEIIKNSDGTWDFRAIGNGTKDRSISEVVRHFTKGRSPHVMERHPSGENVANSNSSEQPRKRGLFGRLFG